VPAEVAHEKARLDAALVASVAELEQLRERILSEIGEAESEIIASHRALISDPSFVAKLDAHIEVQLVNAEFAVHVECDALAEPLRRADSPYLRERAADVLDLKQRLLKHLGYGASATLQHLPPRTVLVARELLPSDTLNLDRGHVVGLALEHGAPTSHAAILARAMGIPAVGNVHDLVNQVRDGGSLLVDGERGEVVVDPLPAQILGFGAARRCYEEANERACEGEAQECITTDGVRLSLLANIGRPTEVDQVRVHHLDGVGLFRTEYLFLDSPVPPDLERQRNAYASVLAELDDQPLVIRTLDLGGDKKPSFRIPELTGTGASMRGLRLSLCERQLFLSQLRAILEVSSGTSRLGILLPMVLSADDFKRAQDAFESVASAMRIEARPALGAMIETPSALFELDELLELADFVSIGTNDLVQFMLAIERRSMEAFEEDVMLQPAVLRALARVVRAAESHAKELTVCGEAAGEPRAACLLAGIGVRKLSMSPVRAARVRATLRRQRHRDLKALAEEALGSKSREQVRGLVREVVPFE
jgi:phosphoenolpyruvate-protein phosphotransferase